MFFQYSTRSQENEFKVPGFHRSEDTSILRITPDLNDIITLICCGPSILANSNYDFYSILSKNLPSEEKLNKYRSNNIKYLLGWKNFHANIKKDIQEELGNKLYSGSIFLNNYSLEYQGNLPFQFQYVNCMCIKDNILAFLLNPSTLVLTRIVAHTFTSFHQIPIDPINRITNGETCLQFHSSKKNTLVIFNRFIAFEVAFSEDLELIGKPTELNIDDPKQIFHIDATDNYKVCIESIYPLDLLIEVLEAGKVFQPQQFDLGVHNIFFTRNCLYIWDLHDRSQLNLYDFRDRCPSIKSFDLPVEKIVSMCYNPNDNCIYALKEANNSFAIQVLACNDTFLPNHFHFNDSNVQIGGYITTKICKPDSDEFIDVKSMPFHILDHAIYLYPNNVKIDDAKKRLIESTNSNQMNEAKFVFINNLDYFAQDKKFFSEFFEQTVLPDLDDFLKSYLNSQIINSKCMVEYDVNLIFSKLASNNNSEILLLKLKNLCSEVLLSLDDNDTTFLYQENCIIDRIFIPFISMIINEFKKNPRNEDNMSLIDELCDHINTLMIHPLIAIKLEKNLLDLFEHISKTQPKTEKSKQLHSHIIKTFKMVLNSFLAYFNAMKLYISQLWFIPIFKSASILNPYSAKKDFIQPNLDLQHLGSIHGIDKNIVDFVISNKPNIMDFIYNGYKPSLNKHLSDSVRQNDRLFLACFASYASVITELFNFKGDFKLMSRSLKDCIYEMMNIRDYLRKNEQLHKYENNAISNEHLLVIRKCIFLLLFYKDAKIPIRFISNFLKDKKITIENIYDQASIFNSLTKSAIGLHLAYSVFCNDFPDYSLGAIIPINDELMNQTKVFLTMILDLFVKTKDLQLLYYLSVYTKDVNEPIILSFIFNYISSIQSNNQIISKQLSILQYIILNKCDLKELGINNEILTRNITHNSNQIIFASLYNKIELHDFTLFKKLFDSFTSNDNMNRSVIKIIISYITKQSEKKIVDEIFNYIKSLFSIIGKLILKSQMNSAYKFIILIRQILQTENNNTEISNRVKKFLSEVPSAKLNENDKHTLIGKLSIIALDIFPFNPDDPSCDNSIITLQQYSHNFGHKSDITKYHKFIFKDKYVYPIPFDFASHPKYDILKYGNKNQKCMEEIVFYIESEIIIPPSVEYEKLVEFAILYSKEIGNDLITENIIHQCYCKYLDLPTFLSNFELEDFAQYSLQYESINELYSLPYTMNTNAILNNLPKKQHYAENLFLFQLLSESLYYLTPPLNFNKEELILTFTVQNRIDTKNNFLISFCMLYSDLGFSQSESFTIEHLFKNNQQTIQVIIKFKKKVFYAIISDKIYKAGINFQNDSPKESEAGFSNCSFHVLFHPSIQPIYVKLTPETPDSFLNDQILPTYELNQYTLSDFKYNFDQTITFLCNEKGTKFMGNKSPSYSIGSLIKMPPSISKNSLSTKQAEKESINDIIRKEIESGIQISTRNSSSVTLNLNRIIWCDDYFKQFLQMSLIHKTTLQWNTLSIIKIILRFETSFMKVFDMKLLLTLYRIIVYTLDPYNKLQYNVQTPSYYKRAFLNINFDLEKAKRLILHSITQNALIELITSMSNNIPFHLCLYQKSPMFPVHAIHGFTINGGLDSGSNIKANRYLIRYPLDSPFELISLMMELTNPLTCTTNESFSPFKMFQTFFESYLKIWLYQSPLLRDVMFSHSFESDIAFFENRHFLYNSTVQIMNIIYFGNTTNIIKLFVKDLNQAYKESTPNFFDKPVSIQKVNFDICNIVSTNDFCQNLLLIAFSVSDNKQCGDVPVDAIPLKLFESLWYEANIQVGTSLELQQQPKPIPTIKKINSFTYYIHNPNKICYALKATSPYATKKDKIIFTRDKTFQSAKEHPFASLGNNIITCIMQFQSEHVYISFKHCNQYEKISVEIQLADDNLLSNKVTINFTGDVFARFQNDCLDFVNKWTRDDTLFVTEKMLSKTEKLLKWQEVFDWLKTTYLYQKTNMSKASIVMRVFLLYFLNHSIIRCEKMSLYNIFKLRPYYFTHIKSLEILQSYLSMKKSHMKPHIKINRRIDLDKFENSIINQVSKQLVKYEFWLKHGTIWKIEYEGEGGYDARGLGRDAFSESFKSFFNINSKVVIKIPNMRKSEVSEFFLPIPDESVVEKEKDFSYIYKTFGALLSGVISSGYQQSTPFPPLVWKIICRSFNQFDNTDEDIISINDIQELDNEFLTNILPKDDESKTNQQNDALIPWKCTDWYGKERILPGHLNGEAFSPSNERIKNQYINECINFRVAQLSKYIIFIAQGFFYNMQQSVRFHWRALSKMIEGDPITYTQLKPYIEFREDYEDKLITMLFTTLESFSNEEIKMFLKFTTGLERIPHSPDRFRIKIRFISNNNNRLPISHTCTSEIEIPTYDNSDIMKRMILIAITNCGTMENS